METGSITSKTSSSSMTDNVQQIVVLGLFKNNNLEAVLVKNGDQTFYKTEKMAFDDIKDLLTDITNNKE
jgi:hypothetical protein